MNKKVVLVVGDKFAQFAVGKDVMTLSQVNELIDGANTVISNHTRIVFMPGQGLGEREIEALLSKSKKSAFRGCLDFSHWLSLPKRACSSRSHKRSPENTLISEPYRVAEDVFEMHLLIDENSELMQDHQTGQHLQGMIFIEAARQSQIVITETFFMPKDDNYSFVLNDLSVQYNHFAFPFPAVLRCEILKRDVSKAKRQSITSDISIIQNGIDTVSMSITTSIAVAKKISQRESRVAERETGNYIREIEGRLFSQENANIAVNA